jgi:ParB family chromosome partitioning protein
MSEAILQQLGGLLGSTPTVESVKELPLDAIDPDPDQPRKEFGEAELAELALSITEIGVQDPITVRPHADEPGRYKIVKGERRYRASRLAGRTTIPALIRDDAPDVPRELLQLVENVQRTDLQPLEIARSLERALTLPGVTRAQIGRILGRSPSWLANHLALLGYDEDTRRTVDAGHIRDVEAARQFADLPPDLRSDLVAEAERTEKPITRAKIRAAVPIGARPTPSPATPPADAPDASKQRPRPTAPRGRKRADRSVPLPPVTLSQLQALWKALDLGALPTNPEDIARKFLEFLDRLNRT